MWAWWWPGSEWVGGSLAIINIPWLYWSLNIIGSSRRKNENYKIEGRLEELFMAFYLIKLP